MPLVFRQKGPDVAVYARWRDSTRRQRTKLLGPAWVEQRDGQWRNRRGRKPEGTLTIEDALLGVQSLASEHEVNLTGQANLRGASFEDVAWAWHTNGQDVVGWRPSTIEDREHTIRRHLLPAFGHRPIRSLERAEVRRWWAQLHSTSREGGRLSDRNCNKLLTELRAILNWAREDYELESNAADGIAKHPERNSERPSFFTREQVEELVAAASSEQDALAFKIAAFAGLRRGEVVSLRWRCVDSARSNLYVNESVSAGQDSTTKSGKGRAIPLAKALGEALAAARPSDAVDDDLVLTGAVRGLKIDGSALRRRYEAARKRAELPPLRFHDLRHTFGSLAVDAGASLVQVQAWMGHSAIQTTMRYLHTKSRTADAELLDRAFG